MAERRGQRVERPELELMLCSTCRQRATRCICEGAGKRSGGKYVGKKNWQMVRVFTEDELRPVLEALEVYRRDEAMELLEALLAPPKPRGEPRRAQMHRRSGHLLS